MSSRSRLPGRATTAEHQAAVARRLDLLRAELAATPALRVVRDEPAEGVDDGGDDARDDDWGGRAGPGGAWWEDATRVRGEPRGPDLPPPASVVAAGEVPEPGRHAARRGRDLRAAVVPEALRSRVMLGPTQLAVVAVVLALGLAVTTWVVVRSRPEPVGAAPAAVAASPVEAVSEGDEAPLVDLGAAAQASGAASESSGEQVEEGAPAGGSVTVDVAGKVRRPGIAVLGPGSRVVDAIEAAGGARAGVDLTSLNLARPLVDGEQVLVGVEPVAGVAASALGATGPSAPGATPGALVDLNSATAEQLDTLPDVGPVTAASIIAWREEHGGFSAVDELLEVDGIGEATLARMAPLVTV